MKQALNMQKMPLYHYVTDQTLFSSQENEQFHFVEQKKKKKKVSHVSLDNNKILHIVSFHQMKSTGFIIHEALYLPVWYTSQTKHRNIKQRSEEERIFCTKLQGLISWGATEVWLYSQNLLLTKRPGQAGRTLFNMSSKRKVQERMQVVLHVQFGSKV